MTGLTSFLYGPTNVGGMINYVYKRPADTPLERHGRRIWWPFWLCPCRSWGPLKFPGLQDSLFSYRLNIVGQDGATAVNNQSEKRDLLTAALSWHITENATLTVIGSHTDQQVLGGDTDWLLTNNANGSPKFPYPNAGALNPSQNYAQPYTGYQVQRDRIGGDLNL